MVREAVIDLGEVPSGEPGETEPVRPRGSLPYHWVLTPLAIALTVVLGGGAPPPPRPPAPLTLDVTLRDSVRVADGRVHVIGPGEKADGQPKSRRLLRYPISAYALPDLTPLNTWTTVVDGDISFVGAGLEDILIYSYQGNFAGGSAVAAVRPGSAEPVWTRPAFLFGISADRTTLLAFENGDEDLYQQDWRGVDTRTGEIRWTVPQPEGGHLTLRGAGDDGAYPSRIYTLRPDGLIESWDTVDGTLAGSVRTTVPVDQYTHFWSAGGLLMAGHPSTGTIAYSDDDLRERWRRAAPGLEENTFPYACGVVICLTGQPGDLTAIDPATGRELWHLSQPRLWEGATHPAGDRLVVGTNDLTEPQLSVLDARTGRVVVEAGHWRSGGTGPEPGTVWVYRIKVPGYQLRYGILDLTTGKVRVLGTADRIAGDCRFESGVLICRRLDSSVGVWRL